ncbi:hypothetical protein [Amycolatopsis sp. GM8]|uniref:hypothetical protein n=1 Tax=Amycolatopsis sp. GM8 TaxID=2896530 RepID=UPI001F24053B|nr:hypothetical protein [Amycolatopsis sp. GM8]
MSRTAPSRASQGERHAVEDAPDDLRQHRPEHGARFVPWREHVVQTKLAEQANCPSKRPPASTTP